MRFFKIVVPYSIGGWCWWCSNIPVWCKLCKIYSTLIFWIKSALVSLVCDLSLGEQQRCLILFVLLDSFNIFRWVGVSLFLDCLRWAFEALCSIGSIPPWWDGSECGDWGISLAIMRSQHFILAPLYPLKPLKGVIWSIVEMVSAPSSVSPLHPIDCILCISFLLIVAVDVLNGCLKSVMIWMRAKKLKFEKGTNRR